MKKIFSYRNSLMACVIGGLLGVVTCFVGIYLLSTLQAAPTVSAMSKVSHYLWLVKGNILCLLLLSIFWIIHLVFHHKKSMKEWIPILFTWICFVVSILAWPTLNQVHQVLLHPTMLNLLSIMDLKQAKMNHMILLLVIGIFGMLVNGILSMIYLMQIHNKTQS